MKFKDALLKIKKEGLLNRIVDESNDYEVCSSIEKEIDLLLSLESQSSSSEHIVCVRFLKDELQMDENRHYKIESDVKYHVTYNVYAVDNNDLYSILFMDLRKIIGADILDSCIERYGLIPVISSILHELSYGCLQHEINDELKITEKKILNGSEGLKNFDDFMKDRGFPKRSKEEIEFVQKVHEHVFNAYEKEKRILLGLDK